MHTILTIANTAQTPALGEVLDRGSTFIGAACHVESVEQIEATLASAREAHPQARHIAFAAVLVDDDGQTTLRMSDDGEPASTAGKPILQVLTMRNLCNVLVSVTRYFGGTLLGAGGLIRAYSKAATLALDAAKVTRLEACYRVSLDIRYDQLAIMEHLIAQLGARRTSIAYTDRVRLEVAVSQERFEEFKAAVSSHFVGLVDCVIVGNSYESVDA